MKINAYLSGSDADLIILTFNLLFVRPFREDANEKSFFSGRTIKRGGGNTPLITKKKKHFFLSVKKIDQNLMNHQALGGG